ncbi:MAG: histidinol-phosphatase [Pseudomonadota bacterium]
MLHSANLKKISNFSHILADTSGEVILRSFRTAALGIENKANRENFDPVTVADRAAEALIREKISATYPSHGIIGEEFGVTSPNSSEQDYCWILDPIDGTRAFLSGFPTWGTLIGLMIDQKPIFGMMNQPFTQERYWSDLQNNTSYYRSYHNDQDELKDQNIKTRPCPRLEDAILTSTHPDLFVDDFEKKSFYALKSKVRMTRYGGDCYSYCLLASGHIDLVVEAGLQIYDIAPLIPIIEGAGGIVSNWDGGPAHKGGRVIASGDPELHQQALDHLNS